MSGRRGPRNRLRRRTPRRRVGVAGAVLVLLVTLFGLLLGRLGQLQLVQGPELARAATTVNTRTVTEHALRGRILDSRGTAFVGNAFETVVTVQRSVLVGADDGGRDLVTRVAAVLGLPFDRLWGKTMLCGTAGAPAAPACFNGSPYVPVPLATGVDARRALTLVEQPEKFPGVGVTTSPTRDYARPTAHSRRTCSAGWPTPTPTRSPPAGAGSTPRTSSGARDSRPSTTPCCAAPTAAPSWPSTLAASSPTPSARCRRSPAATS